MDITSIGIAVDSTAVKSASADLDKFVAAGARAEKGLEDLAAANKKSADASEDFAKSVKQAQAAANETSAFSQETAKNLQREITLLQQKAEVSSLSANEARIYTLAQKGASESQVVAATAALKTLEVSKAQKDTASSAQQANKAITDQIGKLEMQAATLGATARQTELYKLAMQGATKEQLASANSSLKQVEAHQKLEGAYRTLKVGIAAVAAATAAAAVAGYAAVNNLASQVAHYKDLSDATGETAVNIAKLSPAIAASGKSADDVANFMVRLTRTFEKTDDESSAAARGLKAIGISLNEFKAKEPVEQLKLLAEQLDKFADGKGKTAVLETITKGGSQFLGFLQDVIATQEKQGKLTQDQIVLADAYGKAQRIAKNELSEFLQVMAVESLPAITSFIKAIKDVVKEIGGIDETSKGLSTNGAMRTFAAESAIFLGQVIDNALTTAKAIYAISGSFSTVLEDLRVGTVIANSLQNGSVFTKSGRDLIGAVIDERNKTLEGANKRWETLLNRDSEAAEKAVKRQLAALNDSRIGALRLNATDDPRSLVKKKTVDTSGLPSAPKAGRGASSPVQDERKAQLALDIEEIRKSYEVLKDVYSNGEKILEASHSANLIAESDYYAKKKEFLTLNEQAQIAGLEHELSRLQQEKVSGKDRLEVLKKITDVEFKLLKARQDAATSQTTLAIQTVAANKKIEDSYKAAQVAVQDYLDSVKRQNSRTLGGIGKGEAFRADQSALGGLQDKFIAKKAELDAKLAADPVNFEKEYLRYLELAKKTYEEEVKAYVETRDQILNAQGNWVNGATEALQNYADQSKNVAEMIKGVFTDSFNSLTDQLTNFVTKGKFDLKSLQDTILNGITKSIIQSQITGPLASALQSGIKSETGAGGMLGSFLSNIFGGGVGAPGDASKLTGNAGLASSSMYATSAITSMAAAASAAAVALGGQSGGGGGGGLFEKLFSGLFGGGSSGGGGFGTGADFGNMDFGGFFADGGNVRANTINRVNERGPELLNISGSQYLMMGSQGGSVTSHEQAFGGGMTVHNNFTIGGNVDRRTQNQIAESAGRGVRMAQSRNG